MRKKDDHLQSIWQADAISVFGLVVFVLLMFGVERWLNPVFTPVPLLFTGIVLALVPGVIWLAFFYRRDLQAPEPKGLILQMSVLGGLLAAAVGIPLVERFFRVEDWLYASGMTHFLGSVLVVGFTHEFLKYAAVRFSVYHSAEFDEPLDGVIYATAAGVGYATMLNITFVLASGGVHLGAGAIRVAMVTLAHASIAGVMGYFLGTGKFHPRPIWWETAGLSLAALLNGIFFYFRSAIVQGGIDTGGGYAQNWSGLLFAAIFAILITGALSAAIRKTLATVPEVESHA